jgi:hypothetical protein
VGIDLAIGLYFANKCDATLSRMIEIARIFFMTNFHFDDWDSLAQN